MSIQCDVAVIGAGNAGSSKAARHRPPTMNAARAPDPCRKPGSARQEPTPCIH